MQNYKTLFSKIVPIIILLFAIGYSLFLSVQLVFSYTPTWTLSVIIQTTLLSLEFIIIFTMGILPFFSQHKPVFIISVVLVVIDIILSIVFWWEFISIINIIYLLVVLLFNYWNFHN